MARGDVTIATLGAVTIDGVTAGGSNDFAEEFTYRITTPDDLSVLQVGSDGATTHFANDPTCEVEFAFKPTSSVNTFLETKRQNQNTQNAYVFPITIISDANETIYFDQCSIKKAPDIESVNKTISPRIWGFNSQNYNNTV